MSYINDYSILKFNTFNGTSYPKQYLVYFMATCGNTRVDDALLYRQFVCSLTSTTFEWYAELSIKSIKTFIELEIIFVKKFTVLLRVIIVDLLLENRRRDESVTKYIFC